MDRRIIIIHPSAIIRKGLLSILRDAFSDDFLLLDSIRDLQDYSSLSGLELIILYNKSFKQESDVYFSKLSNLENKLIPILIQEESNDNNSVITIHDDTSEIINKVKSALNDDLDGNDTVTGLSDREKDVLKLVAFGHPNKEIADKLFISIHTVITHRKHITEKLGIKSISGLTVYAILNKLIDTKNIDPSSLI